MIGRGAAIGTFDGVHRGHRTVLDLLTEQCKERNYEPIVITFDRHPLALISPDKEPVSLTTPAQRGKLLRESGVVPLVLEFNETLRNTTAKDWIRHIHEEFGVRMLVIGYDNTFGCDGVNLSVADFRKIANEVGIDIVVAQELKEISSSAIRKAVLKGDVESAKIMLGRSYSITGRIVDGNKLGRLIGFPTANVEPDKRVAIPGEGVYAAEAVLPDGGKNIAMVNIGKRPTVKRGNDRVIEAHLIDWEGDLYGKEITLRFLKRIRDEKEFISIDELRKQLMTDKETVKSFKNVV